MTENGASVPHEGDKDDDAALDDTFRVKYVQDYIAEMWKAITFDKVNVKGYYLWSLLDNFEVRRRRRSAVQEERLFAMVVVVVVVVVVVKMTMMMMMMMVMVVVTFFLLLCFFLLVVGWLSGEVWYCQGQF